MPRTFTSELAKRIQVVTDREKRQRKISLTKLAEEMGLDKGTLSRARTGGRGKDAKVGTKRGEGEGPTARTLARIAKECGVSADYLLFGIEGARPLTTEPPPNLDSLLATGAFSPETVSFMLATAFLWPGDAPMSALAAVAEAYEKMIRGRREEKSPEAAP